jgi:F-type H+-transporting ATPase subunit b
MSVSKPESEIVQNPTIFDSLGINLTSFVFYLVCFGITFYVLHRFLFKPLLVHIRTRNEQTLGVIESEKEMISQMRELQSEKENLKTALYKEKNRAYEEGRLEGLEAKAKIIESAESQAGIILESGRKEVEGMKNNVRNEVEREVISMWQNVIQGNLQGLKLDQASQSDVMKKLLNSKI